MTHQPNTAYMVSIAKPDGSPYRDTLDRSLVNIGAKEERPTEWCAHSEADRDRMVNTAIANGYTPHVRVITV